MKEDEARYFITRVFKNAVETFPEFDPDIHCVGSAVSWPKKKAEEVQVTAIERLGTEAESPVVATESPKSKKDETKWKRAIKRRKTNSGEAFEWVKKKGKEKGQVEKIRKKEVNQPVHAK